MRKKMDDFKKLEIKQKIIDSTIEIIEREGFDAISIRKVASLSNYTAGNIYQYFENKEHLIREVVKYGYMKIIKSISLNLNEFDCVEEKIKKIFFSYIKTALSMSEYYKAVMLSEDNEVLDVTSVLNNDLNKKQKAITLLEELIQLGIEKGEFKECDNKQIAKVIWTSIFGLIVRLIIENQKNELIVNSLIEANFDLLFSGLKK